MFNTHEGKNVRKGKNETVYIFFQGSTPPRLLSPHVSSWWRVLNGPQLLDGYFIDVHVRACCSFLLQLCLMVLQYCCNESLRTAEGSSQRQTERGRCGCERWQPFTERGGTPHPVSFPTSLVFITNVAARSAVGERKSRAANHATSDTWREVLSHRTHQQVWSASIKRRRRHLVWVPPRQRLRQGTRRGVNRDLPY